MTRTLTTAIALGLLLAASARAADDVIRPKTGAEAKGTITRLEIDGLTYEVAGKATTLKPEDVASYTLGNVPQKQRDGESALASKNWDVAIKAFQDALADPKMTHADVHKQFIYLGLARAQRGKKDYDAAIATVGTLLKECKKAWVLVDAVQEALDAAHEKGDDGKANEILNTMRAGDEPVRGYAELLSAKRLYADKDYAKALSALSKIVANATQPYAVEAKVWTIRALRMAKKTTELESLCRAATGNKDAPAALQQAAWAGLGDALMEKVAADKSALHEALAACTTAISFGPPPRDESPDDYADALVNAARCYVKTGEAAGKQEAKDAARSRASGYYVEVRSRYPNTEWEKMAKQEYEALTGGGGEAQK